MDVFEEVGFNHHQLALSSECTAIRMKRTPPRSNGIHGPLRGHISRSH